jgi:hypothetical protein
MSEHDSFEDRIRAVAAEISRSVQRMSEVDLDEIAERYGVDADRARTFADAASQWLNERMSSSEPLFGSGRPADHDSAVPGTVTDFDAQMASSPGQPPPASAAGPHPLDLPSGRQGLALSALDSGRWTVRPGSNQLAGTDVGTPPSAASDLVSELRARDWITADGTLTLVGRHALARWCRTAEDPVPPTPGPDAPPDL